MSAMETIRTLEAASDRDFATNRDRTEVIRLCQTLLTRLQDPFERVWEVVVDVPALTASIKLCLDIELFRKWKELGNGEKTCHDLAKMVDFKQVDTLGRILKHLAAHAVIEEVDVETFKPTRFSNAMLTSAKAGINYFYDTSAKLYLNLPKYCQQCGYDVPSNPRDGLFQRTFDCKGQSAFEFYAMLQHREMSATFNDWLKAYRLHRLPWTELYPSEDILSAYTERPLIVDIGGSLGDDLELFRKRHPEHVSRLVLQDLPNKVAHAVCSTEIRRVPHDFFTPQPESSRGARVYYLHSIIHDWGDCEARKILEHIKDAMVPGYSKLLINDVVVPVREASRRDTSVDVHMMAKLGGRERTDEMLRNLIEGLGLRVLKIWGSESSETSILEAELPSFLD